MNKLRTFLLCGALLCSLPAARAQNCDNALLTASWNGGLLNGNSTKASISADGRWVAFESSSTNLVPGDTNNWPDVFVVDRTSGAIERVSVSSAGAQAVLGGNSPSISADGRFVAFTSISGDLVSGDTNGVRDIFLRDRTAGTTTRISLSPLGYETDFGSDFPVISADGQHVAFESDAIVGTTYGLLDNERKDVGRIGGMWVAALQRRRGVGRALLAAVLVWARERGLKRVSLWAPASESAAVALYSRAGFKDTGRQRPLPTNAELRIIEMEIDL